MWVGPAMAFHLIDKSMTPIPVADIVEVRVLHSAGLAAPHGPQTGPGLGVTLVPAVGSTGSTGSTAR